MLFLKYRRVYLESLLENMFRNTNDINNIDKIIKYIEKKSSLKFHKSRTTNSWYSERGNIRIRLSDHTSKFSERSRDIFGKDAIDLNIFYYHPDAIVHIINNTDPFFRYNKGDKIRHTHPDIGIVTYLDSDYSEGWVQVIKRDGKVIKYDIDRFLGKYYQENP